MYGGYHDDELVGRVRVFDSTFDVSLCHFLDDYEFARPRRRTIKIKLM